MGKKILTLLTSKVIYLYSILVRAKVQIERLLLGQIKVQVTEN